MSTIKNPVGPQPPSVYWRRRILLIAVLAVIVIVVVLIIVRPGVSDSKTPTGGQTGTNGATTPAASTDPSAACDPSVIVLTAVTDAASYAAGAQPQLSMTIANNGASACTVDVGTDAQVYTITSGSDPIWNSTDCQTDKTALKQVLEPGIAKALSTTPFAWDRTRSSTTTCASTSRPPVTAGGASYHLNVKLGTIASKSSKQFVLQ